MRGIMDGRTQPTRATWLPCAASATASWPCPRRRSDMLEAHSNEPRRLIFMQRSIRLVAACAMALTLACAAFAQSGMSYLEGNVKGVDGKPLQGAVLKLERTDG